MSRIIGRHRTSNVWSTVGPVYGTRFPELAYQRQGECWRVLDVHGAEGRIEDARPIGPFYPNRQALLDDFERYAAQYGCR